MCPVKYQARMGRGMKVFQLSIKGEAGGMEVFQVRVRRGAGASMSAWCSATNKAAIHLGKMGIVKIRR